MPGNYSEESIQHSELGESLKSLVILVKGTTLVELFENRYRVEYWIKGEGSNKKLKKFA